MQASTLLNATVKFPTGKAIETRYGMRINIVAKLETGEDVTIWANDTDTFLTGFRKGDSIQLVKDAKGYKVVEVAANNRSDTPQQTAKAMLPTPQPQQQTPSVKTFLKWKKPSKEERQNIIDFSDFNMKVYHHIFTGVCNQFQNEALKDENLKDITTTIFIQTMRKFNV